MSYEKFQNKYRIPSARAKWHNYSGGDYFITICTAKREHYFGKIKNGEMQLTEIGKYADECVQKIETHYDDVEIPLYVIMPNHVHMIVIITDANTPNVVETPHCDVSNIKSNENNVVETPHCDVSTTTINTKMQFIANKCGRLSHVISRFKSAVTRYANENNISFKWQTRFHDHIIRNQNESNKIAQYIENNPYNWTTDDYC